MRNYYYKTVISGIPGLMGLFTAPSKIRNLDQGEKEGGF